VAVVSNAKLETVSLGAVQELEGALTFAGNAVLERVSAVELIRVGADVVLTSLAEFKQFMAPKLVQLDARLVLSSVPELESLCETGITANGTAGDVLLTNTPRLQFGEVALLQKGKISNGLGCTGERVTITNKAEYDAFVVSNMSWVAGAGISSSSRSRLLVGLAHRWQDLPIAGRTYPLIVGLIHRW
jgi:hypothetical protein